MPGVRSSVLLVLLALLLPMAAVGQKVELRVDMPRGQRSIGVGDQFYITYQVSDISATPEQPKNIQGAKCLYFDRTGQSSRFQSVNGRTSQSVSYTYTATMRATKEGSYSFGPVTVGGVKSNAVHFTIGKNGSGAAQQSQQSAPQQSAGQGASQSNEPKFIGKGDGHLFLKANVSKSSAYEQEALLYTVKLYTTYSAIKFIGAASAPKFEGFVVEESKSRDTQFNYETYNGKTYATAVIARYIIFPQMPGQLKVIGNTYTVSVDQREYYEDPFWGSMSYSTPLQLNVTPNDLSVNVRALPSPKPADFSGGVGQFRLSASLPDAALRSNQAASVVYTVTGSGNLKYVKLPDLNQLYPKELEVYSPTADVNAQVGASNVTGSVKFDYSFMPLETGNFHIPEVTLVYFNPSTGQYEKSVARGFDVKVAQGSASDKSQTRSRLVFDPKLLPSDQPVAPAHTPDIYTFVYWLCYIIPFVLLIVAVIAWRRYVSDHADMADFNARRASKLAQRRLRAAAACMKRGDSDNFYDEMLKALWGYIGDKLKMPTSELTRDNVRVEFNERKVPHTHLDRILAIIDECEFAKYSPVNARQNMQPIYDDASSVIDAIESEIRRSRSTAQHENKTVVTPYDNIINGGSDSPSEPKE